MPLAVNPNTGETMALGEDGAWAPAKTAVNPQTKEMLAFDGADWKAVPKASRGVLGFVDDAVRSIANGATFGYADEFAAKMNSLTSGGTYEDNLAKEQARDAQIPGALKIPGEIGGAVAGAVATAPVTGPLAAAAGVSKLPGIVRAVGGGAAGGALFGSGNADPGDRLEGAIKGAAIGGPLGGALYPVVRGVAALAGKIRDAWNPQQTVARDLGRAIERDQMTPEILGQRADELAAVRPGVATLADAGGENVRGLVERVAQTPGAGRTTVVPALTSRQQAQMARISTDLAQLTGARKTAFKATEDTMAERATAAAPLYAAAHEAGDKAIWSPELERLSSSPSVRAAMGAAVRKWRDNAIADGYGAMNPGAMVENGGNLKLMNGSVPAFPNLQFWDYTKRQLDNAVGAALDAGQNDKARVLTKITQKLRDELDTAVPQYKTARAAWGGPSEYLDAIKEGATIFDAKVTGEQLSAQLEKMTDAQREAYVIGAISAIRGRMGNDPAKMADYTKYLRSPNMREKIAAIMPTPEAKAAWNDRLNFEVSSSELTGRALGNSATYRRQAERQDADSIVGDLVMDAFKGTPSMSLIRHFLTALPQKARDTLRARSDDMLANVLTTPGGAASPQVQQLLAVRPSRVPALPVTDAATRNAGNATAQELR
jgi:hypothetical protein